VREYRATASVEVDAVLELGYDRDADLDSCGARCQEISSARHNPGEGFGPRRQRARVSDGPGPSVDRHSPLSIGVGADTRGRSAEWSGGGGTHPVSSSTHTAGVRARPLPESLLGCPNCTDQTGSCFEPDDDDEFSACPGISNTRNQDTLPRAP
jgi:hypothetical protein